MFVALLGLLCHICACEFRTVLLARDAQGLKSSRQIARHYEIIRKTYNIEKDRDYLAYLWNKEILMMLDGKKLVAYVEIEKMTGYQSVGESDGRTGENTNSSRNNNSTDNTGNKNTSQQSLLRQAMPVPCIAFYCVTVAEEYRGRGLAFTILRKAVNEAVRLYKLPPEAILMLHLSPTDQHMHISGRMYYKLGFRNALFSQYGPREYLHSLEQMKSAAHDYAEITADPALSTTPGHYVLLYTHLKNFDKDCQAPCDLLENGKQLVEYCKNRLACRS